MQEKPQNPRRIFLSAGEASGDHYGALLMEALKVRLPSAVFTGLGGAEMERAGQQRIVRAEDVAHMGITEVLRHAWFIFRQYRKLVESIRRNRPEVAILIDFPDVNFRLAKHLRAAGIPVVWLVSPQLWAWKRGRLRWVQQRVRKMLVIFPFEEEFYRTRGVDAEFIGHPLAEDTAPAPSSDTLLVEREAFAAQNGLDASKIWIALLPGSRWKEISAHLPALHELAVTDLISAQAAGITFDGNQLEVPRNFATRYEFLLPVASTIERNRLQDMLADLDRESLRYFSEQKDPLRNTATRIVLLTDARAALLHARASVVASGTATVLAALVGNPFVVVYRVSAMTFALARKLVRYPEEFPNMPDANGDPPVGMVNLIAGRRVVPELLQGDFTAANVAAALSPLLGDTPERTAQMAALGAVRAELTSPFPDGAIARAAQAVVDALADTPERRV